MREAARSRQTYTWQSLHSRVLYHSATHFLHSFIISTHLVASSVVIHAAKAVGAVNHLKAAVFAVTVIHGQKHGGHLRV
ncbi:hypothetical protein E2C01_091587 [Portunus trituberculatus]|uniref:Uncharacterized protein n=1 Tax=Portunus trituberculatus TaxID=210409 RepID=A0A5B7JPG7_PORTR|nr:hypothetical protein [Portunus trituberculatus]